MELKELVETLAIIATIGNTVWLVYKSWKELRPSLKKIEVDTEKTDAEIDSEYAQGAQVIVEGATVSAKLLMDRIRELREDLENEKKARREDAAYFRRRFREAERDARDYRNWAAGLSKQVIEAGKIPIPFVPSADTDSDKLRASSERNPDTTDETKSGD